MKLRSVVCFRGTVHCEALNYCLVCLFERFFSHILFNKPDCVSACWLTSVESLDGFTLLCGSFTELLHLGLIFLRLQRVKVSSNRHCYAEIFFFVYVFFFLSCNIMDVQHFLHSGGRSTSSLERWHKTGMCRWQRVANICVYMKVRKTSATRQHCSTPDQQTVLF